MADLPIAFTLPPADLVMALVRAGWTQEQIADAVGVTQPTICRIYSGESHDPRWSVVRELQRLVLALDELAPAQ